MKVLNMANGPDPKPLGVPVGQSLPGDDAPPFEELPSQAAANQLTRVLMGKRLKYTVTFLMRDGTRLETQMQTMPTLQYCEASRETNVCSGNYGNAPVVRWSEVAAMSCEENEESNPNTIGDYPLATRNKPC
jgi:hypothetical protein